jgi:hypothetical protein
MHKFEKNDNMSFKRKELKKDGEILIDPIVAGLWGEFQSMHHNQPFALDGGNAFASATRRNMANT